MAAIKRFDPTLGAVPGAIEGRAEQQMLGTLADRLAGFAERSNKLADVEAAEEGKRAGEAAAVGRVGGVDLPEDITIRDQAFAKSARAAHGAAIQVDIRQTVADLELNNQFDIEGFSEQFDAYKTGLLGEVDESMGPMAMSELADYSIRSKVRIESNMFKKAETEHVAVLTTAINGMQDDAIGAAYDGDEDMLMTKQAQYFMLLDQGVENNLFDANTAETQKRDFNDNVSVQNVIGVFDRTIDEEGLDAGETAFEKFRKAKHKGVAPEVRDKIISRMSSSLTRERSKVRSELTRQKAALTAREKALNDDVKNAQFSLDHGHQVANLPELIDVSRGTKHEKTLLRIQSHQDAVNEFINLSEVEKRDHGNIVANMDAAINNMQKRDLSGEQVRLFERLKKVRDYTRSELDAGRGMDLALEQGVITELPPLSAPGALQTRAQQSKIASSHFGRDISPLVADEITDIKVNLDTQTADKQIFTVGGLVDGLGAQSLPVFENISKQDGGAYAIAGSLMAENRGTLGREMLKGSDAMAAYPKIIPPDFAAKFSDIIKTTYDKTPKQIPVLQDAMANLYAMRSVAKKDYDNGFTNMSRLKTAFEEVTGGIYDLEDQGSHWYGDTKYHIEAPRLGVDQDTFIDWMEGLTQSDIEAMGETDAAPELTKAINNQSVVLITLGDGKYEVIRDNVPVTNKNWTKFELVYPR